MPEDQCLSLPTQAPSGHHPGPAELGPEDDGGDASLVAPPADHSPSPQEQVLTVMPELIVVFLANSVSYFVPSIWQKPRKTTWTLLFPRSQQLKYIAPQNQGDHS